MSAILALLGVLCLLVGFILFVVGGFRVSVLWGLVVLFLPSVLSFVAGLLGAATNLATASWWIWAVILLTFLPWLAFMSLHWEKAKNGFLMYFAGIVFFAAAVISIDADTKQRIATFATAAATQTGQPMPPVISDWLGIKKPAAAGDKAGPAGAPNGNPDAAGGPATKPGTEIAPGPAAAAPGTLDTEAQVLAAVAELNDRATKLRARKDFLKGSPDQMAVTALAEDIKAFNERLKVVTARQVELKMIPAPPTPTPAPAIPATVVIPPPTPTPPPPKKK